MSSSIRETGEVKKPTVVVAIDKDKGSQHAFKWAIENVLNAGEGIALIHVKQRFSVVPTPSQNKVFAPKVIDELSRELFRPFHCFCTRKQIKCEEILVEDTDIKRAIVECVKNNLFETLVLSASTKGGLMRRLIGSNDVPTSVMKSAPDFTTVCVISKGKVVSMRSASNSPPATLLDNHQPTGSPTLTHASSYSDNYSTSQGRPSTVSSYNTPHEEFFRSPFTRGQGENGIAYGELSPPPEFDISFVGSDIERTFTNSPDMMDFGSFHSNPMELSSIPGHGSSRRST